MEGFATSGGHPADSELLAHVEGELAGDSARAVALHLAGCAACQAEVEAQAAARLVLRAAPVLAGPAVPDVRALLAARGLVEAEAAPAGPAAQPAPARPAPARPTLAARLAELWSRRPVLVLAPAAGLAAVAVVAGVLVAGGGGSGITPAADPTALTAAAPAGDALRSASTESQAYGTGPADAGPAAASDPAAASGPAGAPAAKAAPTAPAGAAAKSAAAAPGEAALVRAVAGTAAEVVAVLQGAGVAAEAAGDGTVQVAAADRERAGEALAPLAEGPLRVVVAAGG